jgi:hypothetical protein
LPNRCESSCQWSSRERRERAREGGWTHADALVFLLLEVVLDRQHILVESLDSEGHSGVCFGDDGIGVLSDLGGVLGEGPVGGRHVRLTRLEDIEQRLGPLGEACRALDGDLRGGQDEVVAEVVHGVLQLLRLEGGVFGLRVEGLQRLAELFVEVSRLCFKELVIGAQVIDEASLVLREQYGETEARAREDLHELSELVDFGDLGPQSLQVILQDIRSDFEIQNIFSVLSDAGVELDHRALVVLCLDPQLDSGLLHHIHILTG